MICSSEAGSRVGSSEACGFCEKNNAVLLLERWSAVVLATPAICVHARSMSQWAVKNHRLRSSCITVVSLAELLQITATTLELSHWYSTLCLASEDAHIAVLKTMGEVP